VWLKDRKTERNKIDTMEKTYLKDRREVRRERNCEECGA